MKTITLKVERGFLVAGNVEELIPAHRSPEDTERYKNHYYWKDQSGRVWSSWWRNGYEAKRGNEGDALHRNGGPLQEAVVEWDPAVIPEERWVYTPTCMYNHDVRKEYVVVMQDGYPMVWKTFEYVSLVDLTYYVSLDSGKFLFNHVGKYASRMSFLLEKPVHLEFFWRRCEPSKYNLEKGEISEIEGRYWVSKKGTRCFEPKAGGSHVLLKDGWGGCFNSYRGGQLSKLPTLYHHRASSNGGGSGNDYAVVEKGARRRLSEDDI